MNPFVFVLSLIALIVALVALIALLVEFGDVGWSLAILRAKHQQRRALNARIAEFMAMGHDYTDARRFASVEMATEAAANQRAISRVLR